MSDANRDKIDELVSAFAEKHVLWEQGGPVEDVNRIALERAELFHRLVDAFGDEGREAFTRLMEHEYLPLRKLAAFYMLRYCHERAKAVLEEIAEGDPMEARRIDWMMRLWYSGDWELDPGPMPNGCGYNTKPLFG